MSPRATQWIIAGVCVLLAAVLAAWWLVTHKRVETLVRAPLRGEAAYNPFYALGKVLRAQGQTVVSRANLDLDAMQLEAGDLLVLGADLRTLSADQGQALLDWVAEGGMLVFAVPSSTAGSPNDLLAGLGIGLVERSNCLRVPRARDPDGRVVPDFDFRPAHSADDPAAAGKDRAATDKDKTRDFCFGMALTFEDSDEADFDFRLGRPERGYVLARAAYGDGLWLAAADLAFIGNERLREPEAAALAWQALAPMLDYGRVFLVYSSNVPPLYELVLRYGWPVLAPLLLALLAWLWWRSRRLGPLLPAAALSRRALREHIDAAGKFVFRQRKASALYAPLRRAFNQALQREDPVAAALDGEDLVAAVAARSGRTPMQVRQALLPGDLNHREVYLTAVRELSALGLR